MNDFQQLSPTLQGLVLVIGAVQLVLCIAALVTWARTPTERTSLPRPAWLLVILLINIVGPLAWFVAGRRPAPAEEDRTAKDWTSQQQHAVDTLYGQQ